MQQSRDGLGSIGGKRRGSRDLIGGRHGPTVDLEAILIADVAALMDGWRQRYAGRPGKERNRLFLISLEREQIVVVAYREEAIAERVALLDVDDQVKALIRQTLVWIWKDEQLHSEYLRGELLRSGELAPSLIVYGRQIQGALSGWTVATRNLRGIRSAPVRAGAAGALVAVAGVLHRLPVELQRELRFQTFRRYCELNVAQEASAEYAYGRLIELARSIEERSILIRIRADEARHAAAFRLLTTYLTDDDHLVAGTSSQQLARDLEAISPWFVPADLRPRGGQHSDESADSTERPTVTSDDRLVAGSAIATRPSGRSGFGSRATVAVRSGGTDREKLTVLEQSLDAAGLATLARRSRSVAIRASFMMGYDRRDRSNINDPELVAGLARYLRQHGVDDIVVLETPTVYGQSFQHRTVAEVAGYFGFNSPSYRIVDMHDELQAVAFDRGLVQDKISSSWLGADLRIVMPKLRTDPTEFAHLSLSTMVGGTGPIEPTFYGGRRVDFRSATMMLIDLAPPDFSVIDCWSPVADGPFGVMGCSRPVHIRSIYAGADALSVDEVVLQDLGVSDPRRAPIVARTYHWFGLSPSEVNVDGPRPELGVQLTGAHSSAPLRALGTLSYPIYTFLSKRGELFVPAMDTTAFPPVNRVKQSVRTVRWLTQQAFGLHPPDDPLRTVRSHARSILDTVRLGHGSARLLAITDSRTVVRSLFLASAARIDLLPHLSAERSAQEINKLLGGRRVDRLQSWLQVGVALGELQKKGDRYVVRGRRSRAIASGDSVLTAHYGSILSYQGGPYQDLSDLLEDSPEGGRSDLDTHADEIANVSMAATPFIAPYLIGALTEVRVRRMLDVGCGTGVYSRIALEANRSVHVDAIDLAQEVIETAGDEFRRDGLSHRIDFHEGDVRDWIEGTSPKFDLILLMNSIYYFDPAIRVDLLRRLASALQPSGQLLVVSMTNPGSVASAHLDFMLRCQGGAASLPSVAGLESDLRHAGLEIADRRQLVPTEPFVGIRARRAHRLSGEA